MNDTIAAIATPAGEGGVSLIRISGERARECALSLFRTPRGARLDDPAPRKVYFGEIADPAGECLDQACLTWFKAPRSYTAEDVVEITAHGGVWVTTRILQAILDQGARLAEPGEFTRRAFLNGRIDLSQAEAVADLIAAASDRALHTAVSHLKGGLSHKLGGLYDRLIGVLSHLEAAIDFSEDGLTFQSAEESLRIVRSVQKEIQTLVESYRQGKIYREGARVAIAGKPNVGKSSLLNALLQEDRAIVTPFSGTTRDTLEERVRIHDIHIQIIDSAGIRQHPEAIEALGIERTRHALERADLALVLFDASQPLDSDDRLLIDTVRGKPLIVLLNKNDLEPHIDEGEIRAQLPQAPVLSLSAQTGTGLAELCDAIYQTVAGGTTPDTSLWITRERHRQHLARARDALEQTCQSLEQNRSEELVAVDLNLALDHLGAILGKTFAEDLLDHIFGQFCIGK
ncbi:MAG: tRNA uridine-5-carboxymethylaminomethyl(34) synthesis GTPase MnmE [Nitrospinae bacterium CG11_big_fil_rev_8_21_14_0_20_56_8]|nr:MAG: tRNA uridine-5-carboxymethylaminomethyl(34) synthesis GTPase MnmE [Nitrospinae bacterium CG11_big_fil_rev_8_21_14_0_20_56_8]